MLGKKNKTEDINMSAINVLGEGTTIEGNITSAGDLRVDGTIHGNVSTQSKCVLGATGKITGNIDAKSCDISGQVDGNVKVSSLLLLKSSGKINGDITTSKIIVENGGEFNGSCAMGSEVSISQGKKKSDAQSASA